MTESSGPTEPTEPTGLHGPAGAHGPGRRSARERGVDVVVALAIALPVVVTLCLALIGSESDETPGTRGPATADLTVATLACPGAVVPDDAAVLATRSPGVAGGNVMTSTAAKINSSAGTGELTDQGKLDVAGDRGTALASDGGVVVLDGRGAAAPGLVAGRSEPGAVPECRGPSYDDWLVGVGASARYATALELVNPNGSDAVVDIELVGASGPVEAQSLRGITVPGHSVQRIDLATSAPRRASVAAHLIVTRGRVISAARGTWDPLGRGRVSTDFLPADGDPSTDGLILGVPAKSTQARLFVVNPGDDEVRVTPQLVTEQSTFTPTNARDVAVPPHSMQTIRLRSLLSGKAAEGVLGVRVKATGPVASSVLLLNRSDLVLLAPAPALTEPTAAVLPPGEKTLLLGGATKAGTVQVRSFTAAGKPVGDERVELTAGSAAQLTLPKRAEVVTLSPENTAVRAVVTVPSTGQRPGLATLRIRPAEVRARIPAVTPR